MSPSFRITIRSAALAAILLSARAQAATITVGPDGRYDFSQIQQAIQNAKERDVVTIADGTYTGPGNRDISFLGRAITVRSENGPQNCIIDCNGAMIEPHRGFSFDSGEDANSVLQGITIRNACVITCGGGVYCRRADPTIANCIFSDNASYMIAGALYVEMGSPTVIDCTFTNNQAGNGAAVCLASCESTLRRCRFTSNSAEQQGGAIYLSFSNADILDCEFIANTALSGAGLVSYYSEPLLKRCCFRANTAVTGGGGALAFAGRPVLEECQFQANVADGGAGLYNSYSAVTITDCRFESNRATWAGAVENYAADAVITGCLFTKNRALWGAAVRNCQSRTTVSQTLFTANTAPNGAAVYCRDNCELTLTNCTFAANRPGRSTLAFDCDKQSNPSRAEVRDSIIWDAEDPLTNNDASQILIVSSLLRRAPPGQGNIDADPCFVAEGYWDPNETADDPNDDFWIAGDYHLKSQAGRWDPQRGRWICDQLSSPCIDAGGLPGPVGAELFPNGGRVNMGAYGATAQAAKSYFGAPACQTVVAGDINGDCRVDSVDLALMAVHWVAR